MVYEFGYGLLYIDFSISKVMVKLFENLVEFIIKVVVSNKGKLLGKEVV